MQKQLCIENSQKSKLNSILNDPEPANAELTIVSINTMEQESLHNSVKHSAK